MDKLTEQTINEINDKLEWAVKSAKLIRKNFSNSIELKQNFWSFLAAFQQAWYYFSRMIGDKNPNLSKRQKSLLIATLINIWKTNNLSKDEIIAWNVLRELRNTDVHQRPVVPNFEIRTYILESDGYILEHEGKILVTTSEYAYLIYNDTEYSIENLTTNGITSIKKLLEYISTLEIKPGANMV